MREIWLAKRWCTASPAEDVEFDAFPSQELAKKWVESLDPDLLGGWAPKWDGSAESYETGAHFGQIRGEVWQLILKQ